MVNREARVWSRNKAPFAVVMRAAIVDQQITDRDFRLLAWLCGFQDENGLAWPGFARMKHEIGSESTVRRALRSLEKGGWLTTSYNREKHRIEYDLEPGWKKAAEESRKHRSESPGALLPGVSLDAPERSSEAPIKRTDQVSDQTEAAAPAAPAPTGAELATYAYEKLTEYLGRKPVEFSFSAWGGMFKKALAAGVPASELKLTVDRWLGTRPNNATFNAFRAQFETLRANVSGGSVGQKPKGAMDRLRHGDPDADRHDERAWMGGGGG